MPMLLTLTHHQYGCCDAKCKPAIVIHFNLRQVCLSEPPFVFAILFIPSSTVVSGYCCGATVGSEQQHNQDLREIYKGRRILEFITFYHNALHLTIFFTRIHCI